ERERGDRRRGAELARHVQLRPVAVHGLAHAVKHGERRVNPEPRRDAGPRRNVARGRRRGRDAERSGRPALASTRRASRTADSSGRPHQKPRPTKIATNTGASAVPSPSSALSTRTEDSTPAGWNAAVRVFRAGTVSPKPAPRNAVATSNSGNAADV